MLADGEVFAKVAELIKAKDKTLWQTIKDFFTNLAAKIKSAYAKLEPDSIEGRYVADMLNTAEELKTLWAEALVEASEASNLVKADTDSIRYSARGNVLSWDLAWDSNNHSSIKEQLLAHIDEVNSMQPVANINYDKQNGKPYYEQLDEILRTKFGYKIERQDHGSITFDSKAIAGMRKYVGTDAEAAAIIAAPYILKRGKAISGHKNHKDKGHPSVVYAAPATLNGEVGNIAVSVLYGDARRVHSLRVLTPSGEEFILVDIKNTELQNGGSDTKSAVEPPISSVSVEIVSQNSDSVNTPDKKIHSDRNPDAISNRTLLANALESVVQNDIERNKLKQYKDKIALIESEQSKLARLNGQIKELSFAKGKRDTEAIKKLQLEATQTANRINIYDRQLLNLESTAALKGVLNREKQAAYKRADGSDINKTEIPPTE